MAEGDGRRRRPLRSRLLLAALALGAVGAVALLVFLVGRDADEEKRPSAMCDIAPDDSDEAVSAAIASCPNASTIRFPVGATYHQDGTIVVRERSDIVIDGNGSTFVSRAPNNKLAAVPNWRLFKVRNVTVKNMTAIGNFFPTGPRSLETVERQFGTCEFNAGFAVSGSDGVFLTDLKA
ncbi:MAG: hypothetical protein LC799_13185, partial [Actinobacteria bacterium]|nr:hypothetical protein [Actinomycetota bacterium]